MNYNLCITLVGRIRLGGVQLLLLLFYNLSETGNDSVNPSTSHAEVCDGEERKNI